MATGPEDYEYTQADLDNHANQLDNRGHGNNLETYSQWLF